MKKSGYRAFRKLTEARLAYINALIKGLRLWRVDPIYLFRIEQGLSRLYPNGVVFTLRGKTWAITRQDMGMTRQGSDRLRDVAGGGPTTLSTAKEYNKRAADWLEHTRDTALAEQNRTHIGQTVSFA